MGVAIVTPIVAAVIARGVGLTLVRPRSLWRVAAVTRTIAAGRLGLLRRAGLAERRRSAAAGLLLVARTVIAAIIRATRTLIPRRTAVVTRGLVVLRPTIIAKRLRRTLVGAGPIVPRVTVTR